MCGVYVCVEEGEGRGTRKGGNGGRGRAGKERKEACYSIYGLN
jgi:hypothetical protein